MTVITAPIIPIVNTAARALALTSQDLIILTSVKKFGAVYMGIAIQSRYAAPIGIILSILSWKITLVVVRKSLYLSGNLSQLLLPRLSENNK
jgi:hypothetical protein